MASIKLYDSLILGGGPAGLNAALGLGRQSRSCLVISDKIFRNDGVEASHGVLGHDHIHPQTILAQARDQISRYHNTEYAYVRIVDVEKVPLPQFKDRHGFRLSSNDGQSWTGKTLVLAAGVKDQFPDLEGYAENWPQNIYQCLFCDGWDRRMHQKAVLALNGITAKDISMASMSLGQNIERNDKGQSTVTILSNGPVHDLEEGLARKLKAVQARGVRVDQRKVVKLEDAVSEEGVYVHLQDNDGSVEHVFYAFIVHKPPTELRGSSIIAKLGLETEPSMFGPLIKLTGMPPSTSVPGVFAAGDCANAMTNIQNAMASGIMAAGSITHYLNEKDDEDALEEGSCRL